MNACTCCDPEGWAAVRARDAAEDAINERLRDLFGVDGENLATCLGMIKPPTNHEAIELMRELRAEYRRRVRADTWKRLENSDV